MIPTRSSRKGTDSSPGAAQALLLAESRRLRELSIRLRAELAAVEVHDPTRENHSGDLEDRMLLGSLVTRCDQDVAEVTAAMGRLAAGRYGKCEECGGAIPSERLEVVPESRLCVECTVAAARVQRQVCCGRP